MSPSRCSRTDNGRPDRPPESIMLPPPQRHNKTRNTANNKCKTQRENNAQEFLGSGLSQYNVKIFSSLSKPETQTARLYVASRYRNVSVLHRYAATRLWIIQDDNRRWWHWHCHTGHSSRVYFTLVASAITWLYGNDTTTWQNKKDTNCYQIKSNLFASTKYKRKPVEKHKVNTNKSTTYRLWMLAGLKGP